MLVSENISGVEPLVIIQKTDSPYFAHVGMHTVSVAVGQVRSDTETVCAANQGNFGAAVNHMDIFIPDFIEQDLLREMHHAVLPLVVSYKRVFPEHIQRQGGIAAQRVFFPQENIGGELSQLIKAQIAGIKELLHGIEIMLVDTQDAELTAPGRHIVYDLMGRHSRMAMS